MGANFRPELERLLQAAGCAVVRQGKDDHVIWQSPISGRRFPVDTHIRSRHTANAVLKQTGLPKAF